MTRIQGLPSPPPPLPSPPLSLSLSLSPLSLSFSLSLSLSLSHTHTHTFTLSGCHSLKVLRELAVAKTRRVSDGDTHFFVLSFLSLPLSRVDIFPPVPGFVPQVASFFPAHCVLS